MASHRQSNTESGREGGAALVEAALILPVLILLVMGIIDFSRAFNTKQTLTHASREAVRVYTVTEDLTETTDAFGNAVTSLCGPYVPGGPLCVNMTITPAGGCVPGEPVTVTADYQFDFVGLYALIPGFPDTLNMESEAVMRCGG